MRLTILTSVFILISISLFGQSQKELLFKAYNKKSKTLLSTFFGNWTSELSPMSDKKINSLNDTLRNVYEVYNVFFSPENLTSYFDPEDIYHQRGKYFTVYDSVDIGIGDTITNLEMTSYISSGTNYYKATVKNLRPKIIYEGKKALIINRQYDKLLNTFLGKSFKTIARTNIEPQEEIGETKQRHEFLKEDIFCWYWHEDNRWLFDAFPKIVEIEFDKSFSNAIVKFRMYYKDKEAYLKKINKEWKVIKNVQTGAS